MFKSYCIFEKKNINVKLGLWASFFGRKHFVCKKCLLVLYLLYFDIMFDRLFLVMICLLEIAVLLNSCFYDELNLKRENNNVWGLH